MLFSRDQLRSGSPSRSSQPNAKRSRWEFGGVMVNSLDMHGNPLGTPVVGGQSPFNNKRGGRNLRRPPRGFRGRGQNRFPGPSSFMPSRRRSWSRSRSRSWSRSRSRSRSRSYSRSRSRSPDRRRKRWTPDRRRRHHRSRYIQ